MVRRRSTVRFRKGAPQPAGQTQVSNLLGGPSRSSDRELTAVLGVESWHSAPRTDPQWQVGSGWRSRRLNRRGAYPRLMPVPSPARRQGASGQWLRFRSVLGGTYHRQTNSSGRPLHRHSGQQGRAALWAGQRAHVGIWLPGSCRQELSVFVSMRLVCLAALHLLCGAAENYGAWAVGVPRVLDGDLHDLVVAGVRGASHRERSVAACGGEGAAGDGVGRRALGRAEVPALVVFVALERGKVLERGVERLPIGTLMGDHRACGVARNSVELNLPRPRGRPGLSAGPRPRRLRRQPHRRRRLRKHGKVPVPVPPPRHLRRARAGSFLLRVPGGDCRVLDTGSVLTSRSAVGVLDAGRVLARGRRRAATGRRIRRRRFGIPRSLPGVPRSSSLGGVQGAQRPACRVGVAQPGLVQAAWKPRSSKRCATRAIRGTSGF